MALDLNATVKKVVLIDTNGTRHMLTGDNPEAQINAIKIYESIELNTIAAEIQIIDTAINLIATVPIVGTETVEIEMVAPNISETTYKWKFVVYGIRNRVVSKNIQLYVLDLFSPEALRNETLRVGKTISGTGDAIVQEEYRIENTDPQANNEFFQNNVDYIDFSEINPFSEGNRW